MRISDNNGEEGLWQEALKVVTQSLRQTKGKCPKCGTKAFQYKCQALVFDKQAKDVFWYKCRICGHSWKEEVLLPKGYLVE